MTATDPLPAESVTFELDDRLCGGDDYSTNISELLESELDEEGELPAKFKVHWEDWVQSEVIEGECNWDSLLE